jgi:hypothetical protein
VSGLILYPVDSLAEYYDFGVLLHFRSALLQFNFSSIFTFALLVNKFTEVVPLKCNHTALRLDSSRCLYA